MLFNLRKFFAARFIVVSALLSVLVHTVPVHAQSIIYRVAPNGATSGSCGADWVNPCDLQYALTTLAVTGDELWVAAGTYKPTTTTNRHSSFNLKTGVAIYGGFAGIETLFSERDWETNLTVLSGDLNGDDVGFIHNDENSYHVVIGSGFGSSTDSTAALDGFTITGGNANSTEIYGGGLFIWRGNPTLANLTISSNFAFGGGGMYNYISSPTLTNVAISGNSAIGSGGMFNDTNSNPTLTNVTISDNSAQRGGGLYNSGSHPTLTNVTISDNSAIGSYGGGVYNVNNSHPTLINVTISGNSATGSHGGGMYNSGSDPTLINVTLSGNSASHGGGGIYNAESSNPAIYNTILWNNGSQIDNADLSTTIIKDSIVQGGCPINSNCTDIINSDPLLGSLQDNGGTTQTMAVNIGSPAIDMGSDIDCPATDQRGVTRPQGSHCDIGAYEDQTLVRYVKQDAIGANDGSSWSNAHTDLQSALAAASPDEEIWVASGTYKPTSGTDRTISFTLKNGVTVYGGFIGTETSREQRDYEANVTTLSGDIGAQGDNNDNSYHVVVGSGTDSSAILDGFTITAGKAKDTLDFSRESRGGGMYSYLGSPTVRNTIFIDNSAALGGGMYNGGDLGPPVFESYPILSNVIFENNFAIEGGGWFSENYVHATLTNVTFDGNTASRVGGGMEDRLGSLNLTDVVFKNNTAGGPAGGAAGGLQIFSLEASLTNVTFSNNSAVTYGGGIANADGSAALDPVLTNVTFYGNSAEFGGGMWNHESDPTLINVTFHNNSASISGGAIYNESNSVSTIRNTILWGNSAPTGAQIFSDNTSSSAVSNSVVQGGFAGGTNVITADPLLSSLGNYGGFTETIPVLSGSSAIDVGSDANCPDADQRGVIRPQGSHCDIGAYEHEAGDSTVDVTIGNSLIDSYVLSSHESLRDSYSGVNTGPVKITNADTVPIMAAERVIYKVNNTPTSFSEMMGLPENQLDKTYWLPWYNNLNLDTQLRIANVTDQQATVTVTIGGIQQTPFNLAAGESTRLSYPGVNDGPVKIESSQNIVAAERVIYKVDQVATSFSEMMALPEKQVDKTYWLPWYNNVHLDTQLRIANVSASQATITVTIDGIPQPSFNIAAGESIRVSYPGVNDGPVKIESTQNIVVAARVLYKVKGIPTSFSEMMAQPANQLSQTYWLPWYNNVDLDTQLRIANVSSSQAMVTVTIGGVPQPTFNLAAGESTRISFDAIHSGPVKIESTQNIVAAERVIYKVNGVNTSFSEMMGIPSSLLSSTFWFPWYNNVNLDTQLRFGVP